MNIILLILIALNLKFIFTMKNSLFYSHKPIKRKYPYYDQDKTPLKFITKFKYSEEDNEIESLIKKMKLSETENSIINSINIKIQEVIRNDSFYPKINLNYILENIS